MPKLLVMDPLRAKVVLINLAVTRGSRSYCPSVYEPFTNRRNGISTRKQSYYTQSIMNRPSLNRTRKFHELAH